MALCQLVNTANEKVGEIELEDQIFQVEVKPHVLHEVVCMQLANRRRGTASTKTRGEVRGGGIKPWKQKGTGRARAGSRRSPLWRGGGTVFGPKPRDYHYLLPKSTRRLALKMALSSRFGEGNMIVLDDFTLPALKTKEFVKVMSNLGAENCLVITGAVDENLTRCARNAIGYQVMPVVGLNVYDVIKYSKLIMTKSSLEPLAARLVR